MERQIGTGQFLKAGLPLAPAPDFDIDVTSNGDFSVNLIDVPVVQATEAILGETLGLNFVVAPGLAGKITVLTSRPLNGVDLLETFRAALELNGLELIQRDETFFVQQSSDSFARVRQLQGGTADDNTVYALPLRFISVHEMIRILQPLASPSARVTPLADRNILLASGTASDIDAIVDAVNVFDVDLLAGKSVSLVASLTVDPNAIVGELNAVFGSGEGGPLEGVLTFVPNRELRSILIITSEPSYIAEAEAWIKNFQDSADRSVHTAVVYPLENRDATELAPILQQLLSLGRLQVQVGAEATEAPTEAQTVAPDNALEGETAQVIADDVSNSILAFATPEEHAELARLIERLDSVANQVLIEATIAEVRLTDGLEFGVQWFLESGNFDFGFTGVGTDVATAGLFPGFNAIFSSTNARVALNALSKVTDVNIVSSPSLLVLDNREAVLNVGDQVPIATRQAVSVDDPGAPIASSIEHVNTGVILTIKPRVSATGRIILEIRQEVSEAVVTISSGLDSPTINQRIITTTVAVDDGESIALGGLIQTNQTVTRNKVPVLGDIPLLGALFRNTNDFDERTELLVLITPRVIGDTSTARRVTDEYRDQMTGALGATPPADQSVQHQFRRILH